VTERFDHLAKIILKSQNVSLSTEIFIPGNPELVSKEELVQLAREAVVHTVEKFSPSQKS
jgi:hypothetical protein